MNKALQRLPQFQILLLLAVFFTVSSAVAGEPILKEARVIQLANANAERKGRALADYEPPKAHYNFVREDGTWSVFYEGTIKTPGNHFLISIGDKTQKAEFMPGE